MRCVGALLLLAATLRALPDDPPTPIRIRVVTFEGKPVAGAQLQVRPSLSDPFDPMWPGATAPSAEAWWSVTPAGGDAAAVATATTGADGWAQLDALPEGAFDVTAHVAGRAVRGAQVLSPWVRGAPFPTILLDAGHAIEGRVVAERGGPLAGALVAATFPSAGDARWHDEERPLVTRTDAQGVFRLDGVPEGTVELRASPAGTWFDRRHLVRVPSNAPVEIAVLTYAIRATVKDARSGEPLAGAAVFFKTVGLGTSSTLACTTTDASGRLRLTFPNRCLGPAEIRAPGYLRGLLPSPGDHVFDLEPLAGQVLEFEAVAALPVRGTVRDPRGPVASAIVTATWLRGFETTAVSVRSGPEGAFEAWVPEGLVHVAATRWGLGGEEDPDLDVLLATGKAGDRGLVEVAGTGPLNLRLEIPALPGVGRVSGRVVTATGAPSDARVTFHGAKGRYHASTDADGSFELDDVPAGRAELLATAFPKRDAALTVDVEEGNTTSGVELVIPGPKAARVEGRVVGLDKHPNAIVLDRGTSRRYPVGADGRFAFSSPLMGDNVARADVLAADGWTAHTEAKPGPGGAVALGELRLAAPNVRVFQVIDVASDTPMRDARAKLYLPPSVIGCGPCEPPSDDGWHPDAEGWFRIPIPPGDDWEIQVCAKGFSGRNLPANRVGSHVDLKPLAPIAGLVRFVDGKPAAHVRVLASVPFESDAPHDEAETVTDAEGRFRIAGLAAGAQEITVQSGAKGPSIVECRSEVEAPNEAMEIVVEPARAIEGRVVDARGRPVAGAEVRAANEEDDRLPTLRTETAEDGTFRLAGAVPGKYGVVVSRDGFRTDAKADHVSAGTRNLTLHAELGLRIAGRVVDGAGRPRVGWVVSANSELTFGEHRARTGADGSFAIEDLEGGPWDLKLGQYCHKDPEGGSQVRAGTEDVVLVLR